MEPLFQCGDQVRYNDGATSIVGVIVEVIQYDRDGFTLPNFRFYYRIKVTSGSMTPGSIVIQDEYFIDKTS